MGWKATKDLTRAEAIRLIIEATMGSCNCDLPDVLDALGYGDDLELPYYGYNFRVIDDNDKD